MAAVGLTRSATFTVHNVRSAWKKAGIYPFDQEAIVTFLRLEHGVRDIEAEFQEIASQEERVLLQMDDTVDQIEELTKPRTLSPFLPATPLTLRTHSQYGDYLH